MKKYLFGLGAMLVGAGLMFVFTHTEVNATNEIRAECTDFKSNHSVVEYCKFKDLKCVLTSSNRISCVKE